MTWDLVQIDFEALFDRSPNPYVVLDRSLAMVWMNDAYLRATMRSREELLGQGMFDAFPSDPDSESHRLLEGSFRKVLASGKTDELALIRYDIPKRGGGMEVRYWSATHTPLTDDSGKVAYILQHTVDVTELHELRTLRDEVGLIERATAVQAQNLSLSEQSEQLTKLVQQAPGFVAILSGPNHVFQLANEAYDELVGNRDLIGRPLAEALPEVVEQGFVDLLDKVRKTGMSYIGRRERLLLGSEESGAQDEIYVDFIYQPIFDDDDSVTGVFVQGHDVTLQVLSEERLRLLINELKHRVNNTLAVVQSLAVQSFRGLEGAKEALAAFDARLNALAGAHALLTAGNWKSASLMETIRGSIEATAGADIERVTLEGPDFELEPHTTVSLAMVVHELSTNALKHGALSNKSGRISVSWSLEPRGDHCALAIEWTESGGPPVQEPTRRGFGTKLVERGMAGQRDSKVNLHYLPAGLRCEISARLPIQASSETERAVPAP